VTHDRDASRRRATTMGPMTLPTPLPGRLQLRVSTASGTVTVVADERSDVVVEEGGDVGRSVGGVVEVRPIRASSSVTVRCPTGTDLVAGTVSGGVKLKGRLGSVSVTSSSGSIRVGAVTEADLRTGSGSVRVAECDEVCRVSTTSGTVTVAGTDRAEISTVSGSIVVERVNGEISARTVSGDVSVVTEAHGPVKARSVSGGIVVHVPPGVRPAVKVSGRGRLVSDCDAGDDVTIEATTMSGRVEISAS
jgi:DUF4097 and DUF4098 domain-containing protein YvlB